MWVESVGDGLCGSGQCGVTQSVQSAGIRAQLGIEALPILDVEAGRFPDHNGGPPFRQGAVLQRGQGVWHLVHQGLGQAKMPTASRRRVPPRQRDFGRHPASASGGWNAGGGLGGPACSVQRRSQPCLSGGGGGLEPFQRRYGLDQCGLFRVQVESEQFFEHIFDITAPP